MPLFFEKISFRFLENMSYGQDTETRLSDAPTDSISSLQFDSSGRKLLCAAWDSKLRIYDVNCPISRSGNLFRIHVLITRETKFPLRRSRILTLQILIHSQFKYTEKQNKQLYTFIINQVNTIID